MILWDLTNKEGLNHQDSRTVGDSDLAEDKMSNFFGISMSSPEFTVNIILQLIWHTLLFFSNMVDKW